MTTIGFASFPGGTGKSLLAFNTAERAESAGLKTLLCDFDPQLTIIEQIDIRVICLDFAQSRGFNPDSVIFQ